MGYSVLLDFDGVLLSNKKLNEMVSTNCNRFFSQKTGLPLHEASAINRAHYKTYGHTLNLLNKKMLKETTVFIDEFNDNVYDSETLRSIKYTLGPKDILEFEEWKRVIGELGAESVIVYSNAPSTWLHACLNALGNATRSCIRFDDVVSVPETNGGLFKPSHEVYDGIENAIQSEKIMFIDDSIDNLPNHREAWTNVLYGSDVKSPDYVSVKTPSELLFKMKQKRPHRKLALLRR